MNTLYDLIFRQPPRIGPGRFRIRHHSPLTSEQRKYIRAMPQEAIVQVDTRQSVRKELRQQHQAAVSQRKRAYALQNASTNDRTGLKPWKVRLLTAPFNKNSRKARNMK